jgi:DNA-binding phage protein
MSQTTKSEQIAKIVNDIREHRGMSYDTLAKKAGVSKDGMIKFMKYGANVSINYLDKILVGLGCQYDILTIHNKGRKGRKKRPGMAKGTKYKKDPDTVINDRVIAPGEDIEMPSRRNPKPKEFLDDDDLWA